MSFHYSNYLNNLKFTVKVTLILNDKSDQPITTLAKQHSTV